MSAPANGVPELPDERTEDRLESWKEIAVFLKRDVRTIQRWEKKEGLPVHRHLHDKLGTVYAFKTELTQWWESRGTGVEGTGSETSSAVASRWRVPVLALAGAALVLVTWLTTKVLDGSEEPTQPTLRQVALIPGAVARVSPNGRWLAYVDAESRALYEVELATGKSRKLSDDFTLSSLIWSRDSRQLAYLLRHDDAEGPLYELETLDRSTGERRLLWQSAGGEFVEPQDWLPENDGILCRIRLPGNQAQVGILHPVEKTLTPIAGVPPDATSFRASPDGRFAAYSARRENGRNIFLLGLRPGGVETRLTESSNRDSFPFWSPEGHIVVFVRHRGSSAALWAVRVSPTDGARIEEVFLKALPGSRNRPFSMTSDGRLFLSRRQRESRVFLLDVDPGSGTLATRPRSPFEDETYDPVWYASGQLSYRRALPDTSTVFSLRNVAAGSVREFQPPRTHDVIFFADSSPEERFTFFGTDLNQRRGFFEIGPRADEVKALWLTQENVRPPARWSSDKTELLFSSAPGPDGRYPVRILDRRSGVARTLVQSFSRPFPKWSPDGTTVAFTDRNCLMVVPRSGGTPRSVTCAPRSVPPVFARGSIGGLSWSADGKKLAWVVHNETEKRIDLWIVDAATGDHTVWPGEKHYDSWPADPAWNPNQSQIAFRMDFKPLYEVWSLSNIIP